MQEQKEEYIEARILEWLHSLGASANKIVSEGYYDSNKGIYRQRKSNYISPGMSDIIGCMPNGRYIAIEVKRPSEMSFFDRSLEELKNREQEQIKKFARGEVKQASIKKYTHSVEQKEFLDDKITRGAIAFFASSVDECREKMQAFGISFE